MKDVISILQSRIAKRAVFMNKEHVCITYEDGSVDFKTMAQEPHHFDSIYHTAQQKTDKRILAEIIRLRREANGNFIALLQRVATPDEYARKKMEAKWMGE